MKKLAGVVIILAVLVLGGYYGMGILTENTIKRNIEIVNQSNGILAEIVQYDRGFFSSDAKIKWRLHVPERVTKNAEGQSQVIAAQDFDMQLPVAIKHGPVFVADNRLRFGMGYAKSVVPFPHQYSEQFNKLFTEESTKPQLDLSIFVNYLNRSTIELSVPSFKLIGKNGDGQMDWMGMNSTTSISSGANKVDGDFVIEGMQFTKDDSNVVLKTVTTDYDLHQTSTGLLLGDAKFTFPSLVVNVKGNKQFEMTDFSLRSDSDVVDNLFSTQIIMSLKSLFANGQTYGPADFKLSLKNIDATVLTKLNEQANAMQHGTELQRQQAMLAMIPELPKLLSKGPELDLSELTVKLPQGTVKGNLHVALPKMDSSNPFELMQKIEGKARFQMPTVVVKQLMQQSIMQQMVTQPQMKAEFMKQLEMTQTTPEPGIEQIAALRADKQLQALEKSGLIVLDGADYIIESSLSQGKFLVNNKPYDPAMTQF